RDEDCVGRAAALRLPSSTGKHCVLPPIPCSGQQALSPTKDLDVLGFGGSRTCGKARIERQRRLGKKLRLRLRRVQYESKSILRDPARRGHFAARRGREQGATAARAVVVRSRLEI